MEETLRPDLQTEYDASTLYRDGIQHCESVRDYVTRDLFAEILRDEEGHVDFLETQLQLIGRMGLENYLQLNSKPAGEGE